MAARLTSGLEEDRVSGEHPRRDEEQDRSEGLAHVSEALNERAHEQEQRHEPE